MHSYLLLNSSHYFIHVLIQLSPLFLHGCYSSFNYPFYLCWCFVTEEPLQEIDKALNYKEISADPQNTEAESASVAHFILNVIKMSPEGQNDLPRGQRVSLRALGWGLGLSRHSLH